MHQLVESALNAANQGDKMKAFELIQQALQINPSDVEALFVLAKLAEEPTHKRQALNRILSVEPTNKAAREMMLQMDRAEIGSYLSRSTGAPAPQSQPDTAGSSQSYPPQKPSYISLEKPMLFRYPAAAMVILYVFTTLSCCGTLWFAAINISHSFPFLALFLAMALVLGITSLTVASRVEADGKGIRVSSLLRSVEMNWSEIANIEFDSLRRNLELRSNIGESATISTQINGYRTIVQLLQQERPGLFTEAIFSPKQAVVSPAGSAVLPSSTYSETISPSGSTGQPEPTSPTLTVSYQPDSFTSPHQTASPPSTGSNLGIEKPLIFRYSTVWLVALYLFTTFFCGIGLLVASQSIANSLPSLGLALVFGLTALSNSSKVEIRESGIRTSNFLSRAEMRWSEIADVKSNSAGKKLELSSKTGESLKISTQLKGYPVIVEVLRQKRSDLFKLQASSAAEKSTPDTGYEPALSQNLSAFALGETRTFRKSFFKQYGMSVLGILFCIMFVWLASVSPENRTAFLVTGGFCVLIVIVPFFQVSAIRVEPNKLTIETFFEQKEFAARQIKEIKLQSIRGRYGRVTNIVNILPTEGKNYPLGGFSDGDEIIYGTLLNWWEAYRNQ
jgi:hypothetical protein